MNFDEFRQIVKAYEDDHSVSEGQALRAVTSFAALAMCSFLPESLRPGLLAAAATAFGSPTDQASLEPIRVATWQFLDERNGNSTTIADATDRAGRLLISIAWDQDIPDRDIADTYDFVLKLINDQPGLSSVLRSGNQTG